MTTTITLIGNLTREPEIRYTREGEQRPTVPALGDGPASSRILRPS